MTCFLSSMMRSQSDPVRAMSSTTTRVIAGLVLHQSLELLEGGKLQLEHRRQRPDLGRQLQVRSGQDEGSSAATQHRSEVVQATHDRRVTKELVQVLEEVD